MSLLLRMIAGLTSCMALAVPGARAEMYAPERVGNGYLGGGPGGFKEEGNDRLPNPEGQSGLFFSDGAGGVVDAGGDFLFATVRGHF